MYNVENPKESKEIQKSPKESKGIQKRWFNMAVKQANPFTPTFGKIPLQIAGRQTLIKDVLDGLENNPGDPNRSTIFIGARGTGKTVLLTKIVEEASVNGWICVNVNANADMLDDILIQIKDIASEVLSQKSLSYISSITIGGAGITLSERQQNIRTTWRSEMTSIIKELNCKNVGLLISVDEIDVKVEELRLLITTYQHFVREHRDVALIMAGLPSKVINLLRDDSISFLRRAFQHYLEPIDETEVRYSIRRTIELAEREIEDDALEVATVNAKGFPFMIQLIGYHIWRQNPDNYIISLKDANEGILLANKDIEKMIYGSTFRDLSEKDIAFLVAMLCDDNYSKISDIAQRMGVTPKYAGEYRRRLIAHGLISSTGRGKITYDLPMLKEYLTSHIAQEIDK